MAAAQTRSAPSSVPEATESASLESPTSEINSTVIPFDTPTPRPTHIPTPTLGAPFVLIRDDKVCNTNLTDGLMQITVTDRHHRQMPGIEIAITWDGGEEHFFTGLKPEIANGYADYIMQANVTYTVQIAESGTPVPNLAAPTCNDASGQAYIGGLHLTFQQP